MAAQPTYAALLRHPKWQKRRLERLEVAGFRCERCADAEHQLHVHHTKYRAGAMPWEYANDELEVLCETCHDIEHGCVRLTLATADAWVRQERRRYFANPDPETERRRAELLAALRARMPQDGARGESQ